MRDIDLEALLPRIWKALAETGLMVSVSFVLSALLGVMLGLLLYASRPGNLMQNRSVFGVLNVIVNVVRPVPFLIVAVSIIPLTRMIIGTSIGPVAAIVPLVLVASVAIARVAESNLVAVDPGAIEAGTAMGARPWQVLFTIVIPEALGPLALGLTYIFVALIDATAVAGVLGGGGLGDLAIKYGYQRFDWFVVGVIVVILIVLVQAAQWLGNLISRRVMHQ
ncbi:MAG TPA: ABC transporter permease subunit [Marisediminicola sp.]|jgi:D-methionine transport system permease protein|nr:metP 1 [Cryobacterium sp.]HEV7955554.1 ABC transporter permease subunit [Marisediminicola sp.]